jgi:hypothetical protein
MTLMTLASVLLLVVMVVFNNVHRPGKKGVPLVVPAEQLLRPGVRRVQVEVLRG